MIDLDTLKSLRERVLAASGQDRTLDMDIAVALFHPNLWSVEITRSVDAALALVERMLPGWAHAHISEKLRGNIGYVHNNAPTFAGLGASRNPEREWYEERAATPPLAILAALLSALIAQKEAA